MEHAVSETVMQRLDVISDLISSRRALQKEISRIINKKASTAQLPKAVGIGVKPHI